MTGHIFYGSKGVRAIEVLLYIQCTILISVDIAQYELLRWTLQFLARDIFDTVTNELCTVLCHFWI